MPNAIIASDLPITESDEFIARALEHASVPALMVSLVHITGDVSWLRGSIRPRKAVMGDYQSQMPPSEQAEIRARALRALKAFRDGGCKLPPPPSQETIFEMMNFLIGERLPTEYVPMMLEEIALDGRDSRSAIPQKALSQDKRSSFHVVVVGAGMSGLLQGLRLKQAGIPFTIIERHDSVGGTWFENRYPGCRVDVGNHFYSYSFEPNADWTHYFCERDELLAYFRGFAKKHDLERHILFNTSVAAARFEEAESIWLVNITGKDGASKTLRANVLVSAVGQLNTPKIPDIPGRERFKGLQLHSADWDRSIPLAGMRIASVGSGASAVQLVPELAKIASKLYVFQRSASWMLPNPNYHRCLTPEMSWLFTHLPYYRSWYRFLLFWPGTDGSLPTIRIDPSWPHPERSVNALNEAQRLLLTDYIKNQVGDDPELLAKLIPKFPVMGKRMNQDNGSWINALKQDNVELISEEVTQIDERGIVGKNGRHYEVDAIVYATGFHANRFLWPMDITGRGGKKLAESWGDEPRAYLGITVPDFPNLFCLYGPGTNLAHGGSIVFHSECQVRYITNCVIAMLEIGAKVIDCRREVYDDYTHRLVAELESYVWSHPRCDSWYRNKSGRVIATSPWRLVDYWNWTREPRMNDYNISS